ncbi:MAG: 1,4-alpha-glucan branching protein GlgB [Lachnospiraceae bacterium]|nr:1,4-alpha-glucan branching protein GlgB [Lachnospiraceae bacterium]
MNKKLYNLMDWAEIEAVVYGECEHPENILGPHNVGKQTLVQAFFPGTKKVSLYIDGKEGTKGKTVKEEIKMDLADEAGFYAALLSGKDRRDYYFHAEYPEKGKKARDFKDVYSFTALIKEAQAEMFNSGADREVQNLLGAHKMTINGVRGCRFAVWAPNAVRVSVVGDFNEWDELMYPMMPVGNSGLYEIFIPGVEYGAKYKYQILKKGGEKLWKSDPYSMVVEKDGGASVVTNPGGFKWQDDDWMKNRKKKDYKVLPLNIYELFPGTFSEKGDVNMKALTPDVVSYVKDMGYTYVELFPIAEYQNEESLGFQTSHFYAPTSRYGTPSDYMYFINELHKAGIGAVLQWCPYGFSADESGLMAFDGSCLYEHEDYRKGIDFRNGLRLFNYGRPEVAQFLLSNALYWLDKFHFDAIKVCDVTPMLYLDYYRPAGEWVPNMYGGNENLESVSFLKKFNRMIHKRGDGVFTVAHEISGFNNVTAVDESAQAMDGLGFDFVYHHGFNVDVLGYMRQDPYLRKNYHDELTVSTLYRNKENYLLSLGHGCVDDGQSGLVQNMPGDISDKMANMRVLMGYFMTHPGKKLLFMGQEIAEFDGFDGVRKMQWDLLSFEHHAQYRDYVKALNEFYRTKEAFYASDYKEDGFVWENDSLSGENVISFIRKSDKESYLVVLNFANAVYDKFMLPVEGKGRYKEIFSSDATQFGGYGRGNKKTVASKEGNVALAETGEKAEVVKLCLPPLSLSIFEFVPYSKEELEAIEKKKAEAEQRRLEKLRQKELLEKEKAKIRASLKEELARKIRDAEAAIAAGSEKKRKK